MKKLNRIGGLLALAFLAGALVYCLPELVGFGRRISGKSLNANTDKKGLEPSSSSAPTVTSRTLSGDVNAPSVSRSASADSMPRALVFGENGPVTLDDVPKGRFHYQLARLSPEARNFALKKLGELKVPAIG